MAQNQAIDSLENELRRNKLEEDRFIVYYQLAEQFLSIDSQKAVEYAEKTLRLAETPDNYLLANVMLGKALVNYGDYPRATKVLNQSLSLAKRSSSDSLAMQIYLQLGRNSFQISDYEKSVEYTMLSMRLANKMNDSINIARLMMNVGKIYYKKAEFEKALSIYFNVLEAANKIGNKELLADINNTIGQLYQETGGDKETVFEFYFNALHWRKELGDKIGEGIALLNIGGFYSVLNQFDSATIYLEKARDIGIETNDNGAMPAIYLQLGKLSVKKKKYIDARFYFIKGINFAIGLNKKQDVVSLMLSLGDVLMAERKYDDAKVFFKKSIDSSLHYQFGGLLLESYEKIIDAYELNEQIDSSFIYFKIYNIAKDSIQTFEQRKEIEETKIKYQVKEVEESNQLLVANNQLQKSKLKTQYILLTGIIIVLVVTFAFIINLYFSRRKTKQQYEKISSQNNTIIEQNKEIRKQHAELNIYKNRLEQLVEKQTEYLTIALDNAEESNRLKTAFLNNISHELRTPLNIIVGFYNLILEDENITKEEVNLIKENSYDLIKFIENLIELSKMQVKQSRLNLTKFDLIAFIQELFKEYDDRYTPHGQIKFKLDIRNVQPDFLVHTDRSKLKKILQNILDNAFKYTTEGSVTFGCEISGKSKIWFFVKDTGKGIEQADQQIIFEPFRKIDTDREVFRGAGIGLSLVMQFASILKALVTVESEPGRGSTFNVVVPIDPAKRDSWT
jgi:signal transduction histidine kinase